MLAGFGPSSLSKLKNVPNCIKAIKFSSKQIFSRILSLETVKDLSRKPLTIFKTKLLYVPVFYADKRSICRESQSRFFTQSSANQSRVCELDIEISLVHKV
jgi:hypothetical protein